MENETTSSRSSSPDPLGQPDLSLLFSSPLRSARKQQSPQRMPAATASTFVAEQTSPRHSAGQLPSKSQRTMANLDSLENGANAAARLNDDDDDDDDVRPIQSPIRAPTGDTFTQTVPLKTGEETPKRRRKRRPLTPRRRGTPRPKRNTDAVSASETPDDEHDTVSEDLPSPTPQRRRRLTPQKSSKRNTTSDPVFTTLALEPPNETVVAPGASPGKRRRVISSDHVEIAQGGAMDSVGDPGPRNGLTKDFESFRQPNGEVQGAHNSLSDQLAVVRKSSNIERSSPPRDVQQSAKIDDPTNEHDEFDSILESEDFTMVSLSSIPSGQQLRSLTASKAKPTTGSSSDEDGNGAAHILANATSLQAEKHSFHLNSEGPVMRDSAEKLEDQGVLAGFGPRARRELRAGLRLGEELAKRQVQAKQAAAAIQDATADVFADLAAEESASLLTSRTHPREIEESYESHLPTSRELRYPNLPRQLPSPEQSEDRDASLDRANEMSWRYDTPARKRLTPVFEQSVSAEEHQSEANLGEESKETEESDGYEEPAMQLHSSPDKQLFLEQALAEMEASRPYNNSDGAVTIHSDEVDSDISSDEEPPVVSDVTASFLAADTADIWQNEAHAGLQGSLTDNSEKASGQQLDNDLELGGDQDFEADQEAEHSLENEGSREIEDGQEIENGHNELGDGEETRRTGAAKGDNVNSQKDIAFLEKADSIADQIIPPRGKLPSVWRRQSSDPVIYSDETDLPLDVVEELPPGPAKRRKTPETPEPRTKLRYDDADFSVLSDFRGVMPRPPSQDGALSPQSNPASSPTKRVRFESEDPENPYLPTTPVQRYMQPVEEEHEDSQMNETGLRRNAFEKKPEKNTAVALDGSVSQPQGGGGIKWEPKSAAKASWLSGLLPSWFKVPSEPIFSFSFPRFSAATHGPQSAEASKPLNGHKIEAYEPEELKPDFPLEHWSALKRLYLRAKRKPYPPAHRRDVLWLLGKEVRSLGWRKRVNAWELAIIEEFLRGRGSGGGTASLYAHLAPRDVAVRLFGIWAAEVQRGETGTGTAAAIGLFDTEHAPRRAQILARARRIKSLAAS